MASHAEVVRIVAAIRGALESLTSGDTSRAVPLLYDIIEVFEDTRLAANQEVWQLFDPFLSVVTVCAAQAAGQDQAPMQLFCEAVRLKLNRIRP